MQFSSPPNKWSDVLQLLIGTLIGLIPYLVTTYRNRKKSALENAETEARTKLAEVNVRSTELRDNLATGEGVQKLLSALIESGDIIRDLQTKNFRLEQDAMGRDMLWLDLQKAMALLAYHTIAFHEAEHPAVKKLIEKLTECEPPYPTRTSSPVKKKSKS